MAKKKTTANAGKKQNKEFVSNPFSDLKGFAVSAEPEKKTALAAPKSRPVPTVHFFTAEMEMLGVERMMRDEEDLELPEPDAEPQTVADETLPLSDDDQFLQAMMELQVDFQDQFPDTDTAVTVTASATRMRQLKQGKLKPEASLDLHGLTRAAAEERLRFFLQNADHQGWKTVLVITGRGLNSDDGVPVLRNEVEAFLSGEGRTQVVEWCRAPKQYGGQGALILFLKQPTK